jgi:hypothetical protein
MMDGYHALQLTKFCPMCGATPGVPCTIISGDSSLGEKPGGVRAYPHHARHNDRPIPVLVKDEPNFLRLA